MSNPDSARQRALPPAIVESRYRQEPFLARPQVVGLVVAGALALIVTAMFTMAELSSRVGSQSGRLQALDLVALQVETVRYQLGAAAILRETDTDAAEDNAAEARAGLSEFAAIGSSGMELGGDELAVFVDTGDSLAHALEQQALPSVLDHRLQSFLEAHETLTEKLSTERASSIESVNSTNRLLTRFGSFGGGLMAFIVPLSALYVQRRMGQRRLASYEFDADLRWLLTANELARSGIRVELEQCVEQISKAPELAEQHLRTLISRLDLRNGDAPTYPEPTDVIDLFTNRPDFPGLRRSVEGDGQPICQADPTILSAAFTSIEWAASQAGASELVLSPCEPNASWQQFEIRSEGGIDAENLAEVVGPLRSIESALASTGLPVTCDENNLCWLIDFPLAEPAST